MSDEWNIFGLGLVCGLILAALLIHSPWSSWQPKTAVPTVATR